MIKQDAINLLGGTPTKAAAAIGCRPQAVSQWPDPLTPRIEDRVTAAISRAKTKNSYKTGKNKAAISSSMEKPTASPFELMGKSQAMAGTRAKSIKQLKGDANRVNPESSLGYATRETNSFKAPR